MKKLHSNNDFQSPYLSSLKVMLITLSLLFLLYLGHCLGDYFCWLEQNAQYLQGRHVNDIFW